MKFLFHFRFVLPRSLPDELGAKNGEEKSRPNPLPSHLRLSPSFLMVTTYSNKEAGDQSEIIDRSDI